MEQNNRPIILQIEDAKRELTQCVNGIMQKYDLPCYFMETIFAELYTQIENGSRNELARARASEAQARASEMQAQIEDGVE